MEREITTLEVTSWGSTGSYAGPKRLKLFRSVSGDLKNRLICLLRGWIHSVRNDILHTDGLTPTRVLAGHVQTSNTATDRGEVGTESMDR